MNQENNEPVHRSAGPHGLGDPNDTFLRKVELEVLIPKKMREKSRAEKCQLQVEEFNKCVRENGLMMVVSCQKANAKLKECLTFWYRDPEFKQLCTEEYLKERAEFRSTGISKKKRDILQQTTQQANPA